MASDLLFGVRIVGFKRRPGHTGVNAWQTEPGPRRGTSLFALGIVPLLVSLLVTAAHADTVENQLFRRVTVDASMPREARGKSVGDLNGDGLPDLLVGGSFGRETRATEGSEHRHRS